MLTTEQDKDKFQQMQVRLVQYTRNVNRRGKKTMEEVPENKEQQTRTEKQRQETRTV